MSLVLVIFIEPTPNVAADTIMEGKQPGFAFLRYVNVRWGKGESIQFNPPLAEKCTFNGPNYEALKRSIVGADRLYVRCANQHWFGDLSAVEIIANGQTLLSRFDAIASRRSNNQMLAIIASLFGAIWLYVMATAKIRVASIQAGP